MLEYTDCTGKKNNLPTSFKFCSSAICLFLFGIFTFYTDVNCTEATKSFGELTFYLLIGCAGAEIIILGLIIICRPILQICLIMIIGI